MKRILVIGFFTLLLALSCRTAPPIVKQEIPPNVDQPKTEASSLLTLELVASTSEERRTAFSRTMQNLVQSGFYPVVIGPGGNEVSFENYDLSPNAGMIYFKENLPPGVYTLVGFRYLWVKLDELPQIPGRERSFDGQRTAEWQQVEFHPLRRPIPLYLRPGTVDSLGRYTVRYEKEERGTEYHALSNWRYYRVQPADDHVLRVMKGWYSGNWTAWNVRNQQRGLRN